ncbi:MAG TPA: hypothetical protein VN843_03475, partial [Anaerolineales bacterium]|nr:hypothetical protein [Anaerolineales bacterium]
VATASRGGPNHESSERYKGRHADFVVSNLLSANRVVKPFNHLEPNVLPEPGVRPACVHQLIKI